MPSVSQSQHKFFEAIAHSSKFAKKAGVKQSVGKEFVEADKKSGKFKKHGYAKDASPKETMSKLYGR